MPKLSGSTIDNRISKEIITVTDREKLPIIRQLLQSPEPSIRWKIRVKALGENPNSLSIKKLQDEIKHSERVKTLLSERNKKGKIPCHPYKKWYGAHWVLSILADIGYPSGDKSLIPLREQIYSWLLSEEHRNHVKTINGRPRRCGSQEGNAIYSLYTLGLADSRTEDLAEFLLTCQWPDGGWNCDKNPEASHSSFNETILPLRGLYLYAKTSGNPKAHRAVEHAAELFLQRKLYRRKTNDQIIDKNFIKLHYPLYWHFDILHGLKVMAETNFIHDKRCWEALDLLESKRFPDGRFPAEAQYYNQNPSRVSAFSLVSWKGNNTTKINEWITADALYVLAVSGR